MYYKVYGGYIRVYILDAHTIKYLIDTIANFLQFLGPLTIYNN